MPNQDYLAGSILTSPLQVGAVAGIPQSLAADTQTPVASSQVDPQSFYSNAAAMGRIASPGAVQNAFAPPPEMAIKLANTILNNVQQRVNKRKIKEMADSDYAEQHPHLNAISNILKSTGFGARHLRDAAENEALQNKVKQEADTADLKDIVAASQAMRTTDPEMIKMAIENMKGFAAAGKDVQTGQSQAQLQSVQAQTSKSQGKEFDSLANLHNVEAGLKPKELEEKHLESARTFGKSLLEYGTAQMQNKQKLQDVVLKRRQDAEKERLEIQKLNADDYARSLETTGPGKRGETAPAKYPGFQYIPRPLPKLTAPPPPSAEAAQDFLNTPVGQQVLQMMQGGRPPAGSQGAVIPGQQAPGSPPPPPPSLVGPQPKPQMNNIPGPPSGTPDTGDSIETDINPKQVPIPLSAQMLFKKIPPLNQAKAQMMIDVYQQMIAMHHPEAETLKELLSYLGKLSTSSPSR